MQSSDNDRNSNRQRYTILRKIDAGGMAEIFLAKSASIEGMEKQVAIKRVLPSLTKNAQFIQMFLDEARLSMGLTHANIVQVFDVGRSGETYFIVMEFVDGFNLRRIFQKASELGYRIPLEIAAFIIMEACKGLQHAHEKRDENGVHQKIVHRDLSPPNILVSRSGEAKITDFGLAKAMTQLNVTDPGIVKGKFSYLSPEAADGKTVDHRADIFAAGICLWELLANRRLFLGKDDLDTVEQVRAADVPSLSSLNPNVPLEFERILARALAKDVRKRYTTAQEFGDAIARYLFDNGLKVTSYDVAKTIKRLFSADGLDTESPEERIGTMIQEEILNLSMLGQVGDLRQGIDGSQAIDAASLGTVGESRFDLSEFWNDAGMPRPVTAGPGRRGATIMAMEAVDSPSELADMLEGDGSAPRSLSRRGHGGSGDSGLSRPVRTGNSSVSSVASLAPKADKGGMSLLVIVGGLILVAAAAAAAYFGLT